MVFIFDLEKVCTKGKKNNFCFVEDKNGRRKKIDYREIAASHKKGEKSWLWRYGKYAHIILYLMCMRHYIVEKALFALERVYYEECIMIIQNKNDDNRINSFFDEKNTVGEYISKPLLLIRGLFEYVGSDGYIEYTHNLKEYYSDKSLTTNEIVLNSNDCFKFINTEKIDRVLEQADYVVNDEIDLDSLLLINNYIEKNREKRPGISIHGLDDIANNSYSKLAKLIELFDNRTDSSSGIISEKEWKLISSIESNLWNLKIVLGEIQYCIDNIGDNSNNIKEKKKQDQYASR